MNFELSRKRLLLNESSGYYLRYLTAMESLFSCRDIPFNYIVLPPVSSLDDGPANSDYDPARTVPTFSKIDSNNIGANLALTDGAGFGSKFNSLTVPMTYSWPFYAFISPVNNILPKTFITDFFYVDLSSPGANERGVLIYTADSPINYNTNYVNGLSYFNPTYFPGLSKSLLIKFYPSTIAFISYETKNGTTQNIVNEIGDFSDAPYYYVCLASDGDILWAGFKVSSQATIGLWRKLYKLSEFDSDLRFAFHGYRYLAVNSSYTSTFSIYTQTSSIL